MKRRRELPFQSSDAAGVGRLAFEAVLGLTNVVEAMHGTIARAPLPLGRLTETDTRGITRLVYQSIRAVTRLTGSGFDAAMALVAEALDGVDAREHEHEHEHDASPRRDALASALNGVLGDHLAATGNPLAIRTKLRAGADAPTSRVVVLVHGLCMNDRQWLRRGHDHGAALGRDGGWSPVYAVYNTGRHISENGRELAGALEAFVRAWPVPIEELVILGHSMGGLVARSACHYGRLAGHGWLGRLAKLVFLGTPHHGAPLERAGNHFERVLGLSPYAAPLAQLGALRSAGIHDLRFGNVVDEDWSRRHRAYHLDPREPLPLPNGVACFTLAATRARPDGDALGRFVGDGLVPLASALGHHDDGRFVLEFGAERTRVLHELDHMDLLDAPAVYAQIAAWLG